MSNTISTVAKAALASSASFNDASVAMLKIAEAASKVPFMAMHQIAELRLADLREQFGVARFLVSDWWLWKWHAIFDNE